MTKNNPTTTLIDFILLLFNLTVVWGRNNINCVLNPPPLPVIKYCVIIGNFVCFQSFCYFIIFIKFCLVYYFHLNLSDNVKIPIPTFSRTDPPLKLLSNIMNDMAERQLTTGSKAYTKLIRKVLERTNFRSREHLFPHISWYHGFWLWETRKKNPPSIINCHLMRWVSKEAVVYCSFLFEEVKETFKSLRAIDSLPQPTYHNCEAWWK